MTTLVVDQLVTTLSQSFTLDQYRPYHIPAIRAKFAMFNSPGGTFSLKIKDGSTELASGSFTSAELKSDLSTSNNYLWIDKSVVFDTICVLKQGTYTLELSATGYTFSETSYLAWVKSYENIFNELSDSPASFTENPFDFIILEKIREDLV